METADIEKQNKSLEKISKQVFSDNVIMKIVDPKSLVLLKENARYFKKETYKNLVDNVKKDNRLSSVPLCCIEDDKCLVLSGNHRVKAAIQAGIKHIFVMIITGDLSENDKIAIQLSHNALVGLDDPHILKNLWDKIDDIKQKIYSGLSSDMVQQIEKIKPVTFSTPAIYSKSLTFAFTEAEYEHITNVIQEISAVKSDTLYLAQIKDFEPFFQAIQDTKKLKNIKNGSLALLKLIDAVELLQDKEQKCHSSEQPEL